MPLDLQILQAQSLIPLSTVRVIPGFDPPTMEIRGGPFEAVDEVLLNGEVSPSVVVSSSDRILAQLPDTVKGEVYSVEVLSPRTFLTDRAVYRFRIGRQPRFVQGMAKLAQTFIRILLQNPGSSLLNPEMGGGIMNVIRSPLSETDTKPIISSAYLAVKKTADDLLSIQARTAGLPRTERLALAELVSCGIRDTKLAMEIRLGNQAGQTGLSLLDLLPSRDAHRAR